MLPKLTIAITFKEGGRGKWMEKKYTIFLMFYCFIDERSKN